MNTKNITHDTSASLPPDKLISFQDVNHLIGSKCRTGHTARALAAKGLIRVIRINERVLRYSEASVRELIAGKVRA